ncbi:hypothetical protein GUJ93_ZPchr0005g15644 [Zizania palustris]|uniref:Inositol polyphosphate-related phosphatase domain-containing protein n=1 Tax=Zizania palustris TaxID=103762 RepID=A0A8J5S6B1_ZIZPA|nr:hypothetical protein GUJ93_ZPchr0005g15644 [Zizania palustris]
MSASEVANKMRCGGRKEKQGIMQGWAEMVSCCGVDCGFVQQLWHRVVLRKWLNIGSGLGDSDFSADECETSEGELYDEDMEHRTYDEDRLCGLGAGTIDHKQGEEDKNNLRTVDTNTVESWRFPGAPAPAKGRPNPPGDQMKSVPYRLRRCKSETLHAHYIDIRELRICVGTWNVGGKFPPSNLDIQEWLDNEEKADIYVIG